MRKKDDTQNLTTEDIEIRLLLEAIYLKYGYDFRDYAPSSIKRQVLKRLASTGLENLLAMLEKVLYEPEFVPVLLQDFSITFSAMFRDASFYRAVREHIVPVLRELPELKIWHAGCAAGEEVYSLAILLKEEGLYDRATIYATDFNKTILQQAENGIFSIGNQQKYTDNYDQADGKATLSEYYTTTPGSVIMDPALRENITFKYHNLVSDEPFDEMHLIFCRNVMVYFNERLQYRVFRLFYQSLVPEGFLCLGTDEHLRFSLYDDYFDTMIREERVYRRKIRAWNMPPDSKRKKPQPSVSSA
jgi:chemotaxis protein methyltransferase CheR